MPCSLPDGEVRSAVADVLKQIGDRIPRDLAQLQAIVRDIVFLPESEHPSTLGELIRDQAELEDDPSTWGIDQRDVTGVCYLKNDISYDDAIGIVAHEFGHACTSDADLQRRGVVPDEWASEMAADRNAYRWGFGKQIAASRKTRAFEHHGVAPGATFEESSLGDVVQVIRVSRGFVGRVVRQITREEQPDHPLFRRLDAFERGAAE